MKVQIAAAALALLALAGSGVAQSPGPDNEYDVSVARPAYVRAGPVVMVDEAHNNYHTAGGRYQPFARLLSNDGYRLVPGTQAFTLGSLASVDILVIANARPDAGPTAKPAFPEAECDAVRDWVRQGGSLLLIADHAPFGAAAQRLANRFGVRMGEGYVFEIVNNKLADLRDFSQKNGGLRDHPIVRGRNRGEQVRTVRSFEGQSLTVPEGAVALMSLTPNAYEFADDASQDAANAVLQQRKDVQAAVAASRATSVANRAQGLAMTFGKGRIVMLGEAAMLSAQVIEEDRMGMNVAGNDNRQFALNIVHWLSGLLAG